MKLKMCYKDLFSIVNHVAVNEAFRWLAFFALLTIAELLSLVRLGDNAGSSHLSATA